MLSLLNNYVEVHVIFKLYSAVCKIYKFVNKVPNSTKSVEWVQSFFINNKQLYTSTTAYFMVIKLKSIVTHNLTINIIGFCCVF